jgi:hypothetical protein
MPVNFQEIRRQVKEMGQQAPEREQFLQRLRRQAMDLFQSNASRLGELRRLVEQAAEINPNLRCARPEDENLDFRAPTPSLQSGSTLLAADGSQINPDRHDAVEFSVINVGALRIQPGQGLAPQEITRSHLLYGDDLRTASGGPLTEDVVALRRDLNERRLLVELASQEAPPVVTLTDGPLELFHQPQEEKEFRESFNAYLGVLRRLAKLGVVTAGYVDKPRADLVVRLLELVLVQAEDFSQAGRKRPLEGVTDADLFWNHLQPGERSAVFAIQSISMRDFKDELALHFFYLNVGRPEHPWLARVEIPAWVAENCNLLELLQATLIQQCRQMGAHAYPYVLHRAHEVALVKLDEKRTDLPDDRG